MDRLGKALVEVELFGIRSAREANPGVIIRDNGASIELKLMSDLHEVIESIEIPRGGRDLRPASLTVEEIKAGSKFKVWFGKKRLVNE